MDNHDWQGRGRVISGGQINVPRPGFAKGRAVDRQRFEPARRRALGQAPVRARIAPGLADRILAKRIAGTGRIARVQNPRLVRARGDADLVFEPPIVFDIQPQRPQPRRVEQGERRAVDPAIDPADQRDPIRAAMPQEGGGPGFDQRRLDAVQQRGQRGGARGGWVQQRLQARVHGWAPRQISGPDLGVIGFHRRLHVIRARHRPRRSGAGLPVPGPELNR